MILFLRCLKLLCCVSSSSSSSSLEPFVRSLSTSNCLQSVVRVDARADAFETRCCFETKLNLILLRRRRRELSFCSYGFVRTCFFFPVFVAGNPILVDPLWIINQQLFHPCLFDASLCTELLFFKDFAIESVRFFASETCCPTDSITRQKCRRRRRLFDRLFRVKH